MEIVFRKEEPNEQDFKKFHQFWAIYRKQLEKDLGEETFKFMVDMGVIKTTKSAYRAGFINGILVERVTGLGEQE